jgi:hypothetical protein
MGEEIIIILENILNQNYIEYEGKLYKPSKGRARGLPV